MPLDKLTLLWEDNQFGRKHFFEFDRITATELETGLSIVLASSDKWCSCWVWPEMRICIIKYSFSVYSIGEQRLSDDLRYQNWKVYPTRNGLIHARCWICHSLLHCSTSRKLQRNWKKRLEVPGHRIARGCDLKCVDCNRRVVGLNNSASQNSENRGLYFSKGGTYLCRGSDFEGVIYAGEICVTKSIGLADS